jgi:hypothetical protein
VSKIEAFVKFPTGRVASIEKVSNPQYHRRKSDGLGVIRVTLRPPDLPFRGYTALLKLVPTLQFKGHDDQGARFEVWYFQPKGEEEIRRVIHALTANGHLTRHQELEAYVVVFAFGLHYVSHPLMFLCGAVILSYHCSQ